MRAAVLIALLAAATATHLAQYEDVNLCPVINSWLPEICVASVGCTTIKCSVGIGSIIALGAEVSVLLALAVIDVLYLDSFELCADRWTWTCVLQRCVLTTVVLVARAELVFPLTLTGRLPHCSQSRCCLSVPGPSRRIIQVPLPGRLK
jgi:hypothetical protein